MQNRGAARALVFGAILLALLASACGSRSELFGPADASTAVAESSVDAGSGDEASQLPPYDDAGVSVLPYQVLAADYSVSLDRVVLVGTDGSLHLVDPHTLDDEAIAMPGARLVSVAPDGLHAAVGVATPADAGLPEGSNVAAYVDLSTRAIVKTFATPLFDVDEVDLPGNGLLYTFSSYQWYAGPPPPQPTLAAIDVTTGQISGSTTTMAPWGRLTSDGSTLFAEFRELGEGGAQEVFFARFRVQGAQLTESVVAPRDNACTPFWLGRGEAALYDACGRVFDTGTLAVTASLPKTQTILSADVRAADGSLAVLGVRYGNPSPPTIAPVTQVQIYDPATLTVTSTQTVPRIPQGGKVLATHGVYVFHDAAGTGLYVIAETEPATQYDGTPNSVCAIIKL